MTALRLLNTESQDKADYLHNQLITDINVPSTYWECAESYLKGVGIYDVFLIEEQDFRNYKIFLRETGNFTKKQVFERTGFLRNLKKTLIQEEYKELLDEIEQCNTVQERLKGNVRNFLIRQGIHHVKEIDYRIRELYESELRRTKTSSKGLEYLKTLDRIKQFDIRKEMETLSGRNKERLKYEGQVIFLPYIPDQDIASDFDYIQDKSELVWDFSQKAPETLKKQIFQILCYALRNIKDSKDRRVRYLLPLRWMYEFCVEEGIDDIERLELEQIKKLETIVARKVANVKNSMQIVDNSRKILFMSGKEIHWYANVWYMERFNFAPERVNPSNPVQRLSFYEVTNERNRELLQEYMKYQVGIGDLALGNIRNQLLQIIMKYKMPLPFSLFGQDSVDVETVCSRRLWTGADGERGKKKAETGEQDERMVYIGKSSTRYHLQSTCHYLFHNLTQIHSDDLVSIRNQDGKKYKPCSACKSSENAGPYYVLPYGTSYHSREDCRSLSAYVQEVPLRQVEYLGPCSYCAGGR